MTTTERGSAKLLAQTASDAVKAAHAERDTLRARLVEAERHVKALLEVLPHVFEGSPRAIAGAAARAFLAPGAAGEPAKEAAYPDGAVRDIGEPCTWCPALRGQSCRTPSGKQLEPHDHVTPPMAGSGAAAPATPTKGTR